uniref:Metallophos domain-containing protein n=1 Tax=Caenorhabditis tropicalis TaxID=1561998 RepID=A0A1I7UKB4_9PELO
MGYNKLFPKSVIVWAGSTSEGNVPLVFIDRNVKINSDVYQKMALMDVSRPWVTSHFCQQHFIHQQDRSPAPWIEIQKSCSRHSFPWLLVHGHVARFLADVNSLNFSAWGYLGEKVMVRYHPKVESLKVPCSKHGRILTTTTPAHGLFFSISFEGVDQDQRLKL